VWIGFLENPDRYDMSEPDEVQRRYLRRDTIDSERYSTLKPYNYLAMQEKERVLIRWIKRCCIEPLSTKSVLEVGCGSGRNLLDLIRLGFSPRNLVGNELLEERAQVARENLPSAVTIITGDASQIDPSEGVFDIVLQSTVFTSLLDNDFQQKLANRMWELTRPGGGVLWYDFVYNNPNNPDVRGVPLKRVKELFPKATVYAWRLTLAPPISRLVCKVHPSLYALFNLMPFLRTHLLCWLQKPY
jgi:SAM-dependent methyltransferase